jgi:hypothetical protein
MAIAVADVAGAFERGRQFRQAEQLRPLQQESARMGLQQQEQNLQFGQRKNEQSLEAGALGIQNVQGQIDQRTDQQKNESLFNTALQVDTASDDQIIPILESSIARVIELGGDAKESMAALELAKTGDFATVRSGAKNLIDVGVRQGDIAAPKDKSFTLGKDQQRFDASGKLIAGGVSGSAPGVKIPSILLEGLGPQVAPKAAAAFEAAGGGKDGMKAFQVVVDKGTEQERRLASPSILKANFPQASAAEQAQLQGVMDAAKTTESGLKAAGKVRVEQKRLVKAAAFQDRAVELLDGILASGEGFLGGDLGDVLGSIEGNIDLRVFSDDEAQLISDIEEAGNILTADNLSLMSGVLSESDIKILKNLAGGALIRTRTKDRFVKDVTTLRDKLKSQKVVTVDERDAAKDPAEGDTATGQNGEKAVFTNGQWVVQDAG